VKDQLDIFNRGAQRTRIGNIAAYYLDPLRRQFISILYRQDQRAYVLAALLQFSYQMPSQQAGRARNQHSHELNHPSI
jgi:hypothetical protein